MRKNPFKTSFIPDFKTDWGPCTSPKIEYPVREKKPVAIFDIREFVKEQKNKKINEMMASLGEENDMGKPSKMPSPFENSSPFPFGSSSSMNNRPKQELSVNDLVKKIDEKLAEIEKEEEEAKKKKEQEKAKEREKEKESKISEAKIEPKEINNITINNYNQKEVSKIEDEDFEDIPRKTVSDYNKTEHIESLDDFEIDDDKDDNDYKDYKDYKDEKVEKDDDLIISNEELERKINDKLSNMSLDDEIEDKISKEEKEIQKELDDYEPFVPSKEDEELLKSMEDSLGKYKAEQKQEQDSLYKPTSAIKLDDISEDDKFFDDFFDD
jgi:hypothetical protein